MNCRACNAECKDESFCPNCGAPNETHLVGQIVAERYLLLTRSRTTGLGVVFAAEDLNLHRNVSLILISDTAEEAVVEEVRRSAMILGTSQSAYPFVLYVIGRTAAGQIFAVSEPPEGSTLTERMAAGQLSIDEVVEYLRQLATALVEPHSSGLLHYGLCPSSVLVSQSRKLQLKLLDFGLARLVRPPVDNADSRVITNTRAWHYMAPEWFARKVVDASADVYAIGIMAYEMLTGQAAPMGAHAQARAVRPDVPPWLDLLLVDMTQRDVQRRIRKVTQVLERIEHGQRGYSISGDISIQGPAGTRVDSPPMRENVIVEGNPYPGMRSDVVAPGMRSDVVAPGLRSDVVAPGLRSDVVAPGLHSDVVAPGMRSDVVAPRDSNYPSHSEGSYSVLPHARNPRGTLPPPPQGYNPKHSIRRPRPAGLPYLAIAGVVILAAIITVAVVTNKPSGAGVSDKADAPVVVVAQEDAQSQAGSEFNFDPNFDPPSPTSPSPVNIEQPSAELVAADNLPQIRHESDGGFTDLVFTIRSAKFNAEGDYRILAFSRFESTVVGLSVLIKAGGRAPVERKDKEPEIFYRENAIAFESMGTFSDSLLASIANIYAVRMPAALMKPKVWFTAAAEQGNPAQIAQRQVTYRISYKNPEFFGEFAEMYMRVQLADKKIVLIERDASNREGIIKALSLPKTNPLPTAPSIPVAPAVPLAPT